MQISGFRDYVQDHKEHENNSIVEDCIVSQKNTHYGHRKYPEEGCEHKKRQIWRILLISSFAPSSGGFVELNCSIRGKLSDMKDVAGAVH